MKIPCASPIIGANSQPKKLEVPLWTVDADVIVPSKLLEKEQYAARIIRPRLKRRFEAISVTPQIEPESQGGMGKAARPAGLTRRGSLDLTEHWKDLDRSVRPVDSFQGGTGEALKLLNEFVTHKLAHYPERHGKPEIDGTSRLVALSSFRADRPAHRSRGR